MRTALVVAVALLAGSSPPDASAARRGPRQASAARTPAKVAAAEVVSPMESKLARFYFERGTSAYASADYRGAIADFELARRFRPAPALDYNLGRCLDRLEELHEAIRAYERFLASGAAGRDEATVKQRVALLRHRLSSRRRGAAH